MPERGKAKTSRDSNSVTTQNTFKVIYRPTLLSTFPLPEDGFSLEVSNLKFENVSISPDYTTSYHVSATLLCGTYATLLAQISKNWSILSQAIYPV